MHDFGPYILCALFFAFAVWQGIAARIDYRERRQEYRTDRDALLRTFLAREELWLDKLGETERALVAAFGLPGPGAPAARQPAGGHHRSTASPDEEGGAAGDPADRVSVVPPFGGRALAPDEIEEAAALRDVRVALAPSRSA